MTMTCEEKEKEKEEEGRRGVSVALIPPVDECTSRAMQMRMYVCTDTYSSTRK